MDLNIRGLANYLLLPVSGVFYLLSRVRKFLYQINLLTTYNFNVDVIVVGNITVGGSGKTPIVIALVNYFKQQGKRVGVVSRGYGGTHQQGSLLVEKSTSPSVSGDEPSLIAIQTQVPVMVNRDRVQAVKDLIIDHNVDLVISDDGLQHYAMGRQIEIAVVDGKQRFGNGFFLPSGPLRESKSRLKTVDFVVNNGAQCEGEVTSVLKPLMFVNVATNEEQPLDFFNQQTCHAVAGIGYPQRFFETLTQLGIETETHAFADHHAFNQSELVFDDNYPILMTAKDCVKCREFATDQMWYLHVEANLSDDFLTELTNKL
jgi:tetraacyldisaccharide 4'-kinase